ncbi:MAG: plasmid pRiA4b ORF-3 family protein [Tannerella sp.]|jgi:hypothetical protein|nr:plasmid pRiA4b ORF-3 family protein [Tannerella sp.]
MIYKFLLLSDEVDSFEREIQISSQSSFYDFHKAILEATGYEEKQLCTFFICGADWRKQTEVTQIEMDTSSEEDSYTMEDTVLEDLLEEEHQKLLYIFDQLSERMFFIELREIITGKDISKPVCSKSQGNPPVQFVDYETVIKDSHLDLDDNFYGEDEYDDEELGELGEGSFDDDPFSDRY